MVDPNLSSQLELFISCQNLPKLDALSKSDPFAVLSVKDHASNRFQEIGRTSGVKDSEDPEWKEQFKIDYFFEENQVIRVDIYDRDNSSDDLSKQDHAGSCDFVLGELVAAPGQAMKGRLRSKKGKMVKHSGKPSTCTVKCEEVSGINDLITLQFRGVRLEKMDVFGGADPYLQIFRSREDESWILVHQTETLKKTRDPQWKAFTISAQSLCNGDYDRPLWLKVFDWDSNSDDDLIGEAQCSLSDLVSGDYTTSLVRFSNTGRKKDKNYGHLKVVKANVKKQDSFLDYIKGGCTVSLMVAIDYTGSNGNPDDPRSLHYLDPNHPNEYVRAITAIGNVLTPYDTDQKFPVWGFGARIGDQTSHCFSLTFDESNPEVVGVPGILDAYFQSFPKLRLSGPTLFQQVLDTSVAMSSVPFSDSSQSYFILLILTDGIINDMKKTINSVVEASERPLSIIVVGVGQADFGKMIALDGDGQALVSSTGKKAKRDVVQFVPFRDFDGQHISRLAKVTLAEVPKQFLGFMKSHNIRPMDPAARWAAYQAELAKEAGQSGPVLAASPSNQDPGYYDSLSMAQMETAMYQAQAGQNQAEIAKLKKYMLEKGQSP